MFYFPLNACLRVYSLSLLSGCYHRHKLCRHLIGRSTLTCSYKDGQRNSEESLNDRGRKNAMPCKSWVQTESCKQFRPFKVLCQSLMEQNTVPEEQFADKDLFLVSFIVLGSKPVQVLLFLFSILYLCGLCCSAVKQFIGSDRKCCLLYLEAGKVL